MNAERDELVQIIWDGAVADRVKDGKDPRRVPVVRPKVEALADAILAAGYRKVILDESAIDRAAKALHDLGATASHWDERDSDLKDLYREDARAVIAALNIGDPSDNP